MMMPKSQWRTVISILVIALLVLAGMFLSLRVGTPVAAQIFSTGAWSLVALGGFVAGKATLQYAAGGGGIAGALTSILTDAKPAPPVVVPPAQPPAAQ